MALASTLCALVEHMSVAKQTSSIPLHGRVRRGREWVHPFGWPTEIIKLTSLCPNDQPSSNLFEKRKEKVQQ